MRRDCLSRPFLSPRGRGPTFDSRLRGMLTRRAALRERQQQVAEAGAAQKRIMDEARAAARMRRKMEQGAP